MSAHPMRDRDHLAQVLIALLGIGLCACVFYLVMWMIRDSERGQLNADSGPILLRVGEQVNLGPTPIRVTVGMADFGSISLPSGARLSLNDAHAAFIELPCKDFRSATIVRCGSDGGCDGCFVEYCDGGVVADRGPLCRLMQRNEEEKATLWRRQYP